MPQEIDETEELLQRWAEGYFRYSQPITQGYPSRAAGCLVPSWIKDDEELEDNADRREFEALNASVDSLRFPHMRAVYATHGVGYQVWEYGDLDGLYAAAKVCFRAIHCRKRAG